MDRVRRCIAMRKRCFSSARTNRKTHCAHSIYSLLLSYLFIHGKRSFVLFFFIVFSITFYLYIYAIVLQMPNSTCKLIESLVIVILFVLVAFVVWFFSFLLVSPLLAVDCCWLLLLFLFPLLFRFYSIIVILPILTYVIYGLEWFCMHLHTIGILFVMLTSELCAWWCICICMYFMI